MPAPINKTIPLRQCILEYSEAAKQSEAEYLRLWRIAFRGFKQMGLNAFWEPRTFILPVDDSKTAVAPRGIIQWVKIGQFNDNGELQTLRINDNLTTYHAGMSDRLTAIASEISDVEPALRSDLWFQGFDFYTGTCAPFGEGSHMIQHGSCIFDWATKTIVLDPNYQYSEVVLECIMAPEMDTDYEIPMEFEQAMIAWLGWQDIMYLPSSTHVNNNTINMRAQQFKSQVLLARRMYKPFRLQEADQIAVEAQVLGIKP